MRQGRDLERFVEHLEQGLLDDEDATFATPEMLVDRTTGEPREFDVVIRTRTKHHTLLIGVECRERSRKVGVPEVEQFAKKCHDCGVDQGMIVSSKGFARTALKKAEFENLRCLELRKSSRSTDGYRIPAKAKFPEPRTQFVATEIEWYGPEGLIVDGHLFEIFDPAGGPAAWESILKRLDEEWDNCSPNVTENGRHEVTLALDVRGLKLWDPKTETYHDVIEFRNKVIYDVIDGHPPVSLFDYVDCISGEVIATVGVVNDYNIEGASYRALVFQKKEYIGPYNFILKANNPDKLSFFINNPFYQSLLTKLERLSE